MLLDIIRENLDQMDEAALLKGGPDPKKAVTMIVPILKERIKTINESLEWIMPFFTTIDYSPDMQAYFDKKAIDAAKVLSEIIDCLESVKNDFTSENIESSLRSLSERLELSFRKLAEKVSPPLFGTMEILGFQLTVSRIRDYYELIKDR